MTKGVEARMLENTTSERMNRQKYKLEWNGWN